MMGRMNMGKQVSNAPGSKGVKKMLGGGMASMPQPSIGLPGVDKSMLGKPGKPAFGRVTTPKPGGGAFTSMPSKPMPPVLRGGPAPMPGPIFRTQGPSSMPKGMSKGGKIDGCCMKGKTKGKMV